MRGNLILMTNGNVAEIYDIKVEAAYNIETLERTSRLMDCSSSGDSRPDNVKRLQ